MNSKVYWTQEEDNYLIESIHECLNSKSCIKWKIVTTRMLNLYEQGYIKSFKSHQQCAGRWHNYLKDKLDNWNRTLDDQLIALNEKYGCNWDKILTEFHNKKASDVFERFTFLYKRKVRIILTDIFGPLERNGRINKLLTRLYLNLVSLVCYRDLNSTVVQEALSEVKELKSTKSKSAFSHIVVNTGSFMIMSSAEM